MNSERELRSCPLCGKKVFRSDRDGYFECGNDNCVLWADGYVVEEWNNFWCWKEIAKLEIERVNKFARAEKIIKWVNDPNRKPANTAFTEGPERQIGYAFETALSKANLEKEAYRDVAAKYIWRECGCMKNGGKQEDHIADANYEAIKLLSHREQESGK